MLLELLGYADAAVLHLDVNAHIVRAPGRLLLEHGYADPPPSGVNLMALDSRLMSTWLIRSLSQTTFLAEMSWINISNCCRLSLTWSWQMKAMPSITSLREAWFRFSVILLLSRLDIFSTLLMSSSRCLLDRVIFSSSFSPAAGCQCWWQWRSCLCCKRKQHNFYFVQIFNIIKQRSLMIRLLCFFILSGQ